MRFEVNMYVHVHIKTVEYIVQQQNKCSSMS